MFLQNKTLVFLYSSLPPYHGFPLGVHIVIDKSTWYTRLSQQTHHGRLPTLTGKVDRT